VVRRSRLWLLRTADEEQVDSMVKQALTVAAEEISEKYAHTSCVHNANIYPPSSVATDEGTARPGNDRFSRSFVQMSCASLTKM